MMNIQNIIISTISFTTYLFEYNVCDILIEIRFLWIYKLDRNFIYSFTINTNSIQFNLLRLGCTYVYTLEFQLTWLSLGGVWYDWKI